MQYYSLQVQKGDKWEPVEGAQGVWLRTVKQAVVDLMSQYPCPSFRVVDGEFRDTVLFEATNHFRLF